MKKILSVCICIFMLTVIHIPTAQAQDAEAVHDGDFEAQNEWVLPDEGEYTDDAYSGNSAVKLASEGNCFASQTVYFVGGEQYSLSLYAKSSTGAMAYVKFEYYAGNQHVGERTISWETTAVWAEYGEVITIPDNATRASLLIRLIGGGEICYDLVSLYGKYSDEKERLEEEAEQKKRDQLNDYLRYYTVKEPIGAENLIGNGGFENIGAGNAPEGWGAFGGWNGSYVSLETDDTHSGSYAVKISTTSGGNPWINYKIPYVEGGATYQFVMWYKGKVNDGNSRLSAKFEGYTNGVGNTVGSNMYYLPDLKDWSCAVYDITLPDECDTLVIYPRCYSESGTMYVDDISFYKVEEPHVFFFDTDQMFYYSDLVGGVAKARINSRFIDSGYKADFYLKDNDEILFSKTNVSFTDKVAECEFPLSVMTEKKKEYTVRIEGKSAGGELLESTEMPIYIYMTALL